MNSAANRLIILLQVALAVTIICLTSFLIFKFYHQSSLPKQPVRQHVLDMVVHYNSPGFDNVLQEKRERLSYILSVFLVGIAITFTAFFSKKRFAENVVQNNQILIFNYASLAVLLLLYCYSDKLLKYLIIFPPSVEIKANFVLVLSTIIVTNLVILHRIFYRQFFDKILISISIAVVVALSGAFSSLLIFSDDSKRMAEYSVNFSPIAYPIIQQFLGNELLINFKSLYGLHPYFLQAVMWFFSPTILTISATLALLMMICLLTLSWVIFVAVENKMVAVVGILSLFFFEFFAVDGRLVENSIAFQYEPIRLLFPVLLLGFVYIFHQKPSPKKYYGGLFFFSLASIWNIDSGIPTFVALVLALGYELLPAKLCEKINHLSLQNVQTRGFPSYISVGYTGKIIAKHVLKSALIFLGSWLGLVIFLRIKYGIWPHLSWIFYGQSAAFDFAYAMLPINNLAVWSVVLLIYVIGLVVSLNNFFAKKFSAQNSLIFATTLLGIGLFSYFIGRSHISNIVHCGYPAVILLAIFADRFCCQMAVEEEKKFSHPRFDRLLQLLPLLIISWFAVSFCVEVFANKTLHEKLQFTRNEEKPYFVMQSDFIRDRIGFEDFQNQEVLFIDIDDNDYYFDLTFAVKSPLEIVNMRHMFYQKEFNDLRNLIDKHQKKWVVLIEPVYQNAIPLLDKNEISSIKISLQKNYHIEAEVPNGALAGVTIFKIDEAAK